MDPPSGDGTAAGTPVPLEPAIPDVTAAVAADGASDAASAAESSATPSSVPSGKKKIVKKVIKKRKIIRKANGEEVVVEETIRAPVADLPVSGPEAEGAGEPRQPDPPPEASAAEVAQQPAAASELPVRRKVAKQRRLADAPPSVPVGEPSSTLAGPDLPPSRSSLPPLMPSKSISVDDTNAANPAKGANVNDSDVERELSSDVEPDQPLQPEVGIGEDPAGAGLRTEDANSVPSAASSSGNNSARSRALRELAGEARLSMDDLKQIFPGNHKIPEHAYADCMICVHVDTAGALKEDSYAVHPVVRVSLLDESTGLLLKKPDISQNVTTWMENVYDGNISYVLPIMTRPCDLRETKTTVATWDETLIFNLDYQVLLKNPNLIFFFEVLEFGRDLPLGRKIRSPDGLNRICWGFFRPLSQANRKALTERNVDIQLWKHRVLKNSGRTVVSVLSECFGQLNHGHAVAGTGRSPDASCSSDAVASSSVALVDRYPRAAIFHEYLNWRDSLKLFRKRYPTSLQAKVFAIPRIPTREVSSRPQFAYEKEVGAVGFDDLRKQTRKRGNLRKISGSAAISGDGALGGVGSDDEPLDPEEAAERKLLTLIRVRRRRPDEPCKIPSKLLYQFDLSSDPGASLGNAGGAGRPTSGADLSSLGSLVLRISDSGRFLVVACTSRFFHQIKLFDLKYGVLIGNIDAHRKLIHDLQFVVADDPVRDPLFILSASSDTNACLWDLSRLVGGENTGGSLRRSVSNSSMLNASSSVAIDDTLMNVTLNAPTGSRSAAAGSGLTGDHGVAASAESADVRSSAKDGPSNSLGGRPYLVMKYQHPCFVYAARMHPSARIIFTGAFDGNIRLFSRDSGTMLRVVSGQHRSFINSLVFEVPPHQHQAASLSAFGGGSSSSSGGGGSSSSSSSSSSGSASSSVRMYSADGEGVIKVWSVRTNASDSEVVCLRTLNEKEMAGSIINSIRPSPPPDQRRLLVTSRDNLIRTVFIDQLMLGSSMAFGSSYQGGAGGVAGGGAGASNSNIDSRLVGMRCEQFPIKAEWSPDGKYVVSGSENYGSGNSLFFWDTMQAASYSSAQPGPSPGGSFSGNLASSPRSTGFHGNGFGGADAASSSALLPCVTLALGMDAPVTACAWSKTEHLVAVVVYGVASPAIHVKVLYTEGEAAISGALGSGAVDDDVSGTALHMAASGMEDAGPGPGLPTASSMPYGKLSMSVDPAFSLGGPPSLMGSSIPALVGTMTPEYMGASLAVSSKGSSGNAAAAAAFLNAFMGQPGTSSLQPGGSAAFGNSLSMSQESMKVLLAAHNLTVIPSLQELVRARRRVVQVTDTQDPRLRMELVLQEVERERMNMSEMSSAAVPSVLHAFETSSAGSAGTGRTVGGGGDSGPDSGASSRGRTAFQNGVGGSDPLRASGASSKIGAKTLRFKD